MRKLSPSERGNAPRSAPAHFRLNILVAAVSLACAGGARAADEAIMEEITVTAQKVAQSIDKVPIAVTAISGAAMRELGFQSASDVAAQIPNVDVQDTGFTMLFSIRGNAVSDFGDANESPVGFYVDDVYRGTLAGQGNQLFDMERVEVLRGPQGTLYGRNTTGGLINYLTKRPTATGEGYAEVQLGSFGQRIFEGAISGPLSDRVRARLSAKLNRDDGWQRNAGPVGGKFAVTNVKTVRGQLEWDLAEPVTSLTSLTYSNQDNVSPIYGYMGVLTSPTSFVQCAPDDINRGDCYNLAGFRDPNPNPRTVFTELTPSQARNTVRISNATERLKWKLGNQMELVSISSYETVKKFVTVDEDSSATGAFGGFIQFNDSYGADTRQFSQEIRLTDSAERGPWNAGLFYFDSSKDVSSTIPFFEATPGVPDTTATVKTKSYAAYADWQPKINSTLGMVAGLRYTHERKSVDATTAGLNVFKEVSGSAVTGRIGLAWTPTENVLGYATISTGYKSPEFNTTLLLGDISAVTAAKKETVTNYEIGLKWGFWNDKGRIRAAAFYYKTKDKQGVVIDGGSGSPATRLINFGDVKGHGGELELILSPISPLEMSLSLGLLDTRITANPGSGLLSGWGTGANAGVGDFYPIDGTDATSSPRWSVNGIVRYRFDLADAGRLTLQGDFDWQGKDGRGAGNTPFALQEAYAVANARLLWKSSSERYYGEIFSENVFNKKYFNGGYILAGFDYQSVFWGKPRTWGLNAGVRF